MPPLFAVIYSERKPLAVDASSRVKEFLEERGFKVLLHDSKWVLGNKLPGNLDAVIVLGGDGTLLRTLGSLQDLRTPILAVNYGRGGYLMYVEPKGLEKALESLVKREYRVKEAMMIEVLVSGQSLGDALNEAYLSAKIPGKVLELSISKNSIKLLETVADGVIASTPLGSTAYAYSAGGPVVEDDIEAAILVPVCPIKSVRPLVLSLSSPIEMRAESETGFQVLIDGYNRSVFEEDVLELEVRRSGKKVRFLDTGSRESFARRVWKRFR